MGQFVLVATHRIVIRLCLVFALLGPRANAAQEVDPQDSASIRQLFTEATRDNAVNGRFSIDRVIRFERISERTRAANKAIGIDPDKEVHEAHEAAARGNWVLKRHTDAKGNEFVEGQNNEYSFAIERRANATAFHLSHLKFQSAAAAQREDLFDIWALLNAHCHAFGRRLDSIAADPGFRVLDEKRHETSIGDDEGTRRIQFAVTSSNSEQQEIADAWITIPSVGDTRVLSGSARLGRFGNEYSFTNHYDTSGAIVSMEVLLPVADDPESCRSFTTSIKRLDSLPSESEFFLSHYGLTEPRRPSLVSVRWFMLAAIGLILIWVSRRRFRSKSKLATL